MNRKRDKSSVDREISFEGIVDLESVPPPASGPQDVHIARTAVAALPHLVMAELQRAKEEKVSESQRTRAQPKFDVPDEARPESKPGSKPESRPGAYAFTDELPTRPGKDKSRPQAPDMHASLPPGASVTSVTSPVIESGPVAVARDTLPTGTAPPAPAVAPAAPPAISPLPEPALPRPASLPSIPSISVHVEAPRPRRNWRRILFAALGFALLAFAGAAFRRYRLRRPR